MFSPADKTRDNTIPMLESRGHHDIGSVNRPEDKKLQELANNSLQVRQLKALRNIINSKQPVVQKKNNTGLPDRLKSGAENISGISLDDVTVHYNSTEPGKLNAHAYAQGPNIHVAPGQEQHLPHETWHVVQQKQGRVAPTFQMHGGINVNDDVSLEKEADVMGEMAMSNVEGAETVQRVAINDVVQRHGPGHNHDRYVEDQDQHLDRHLAEWSYYFPGNVTTIDDVRRVARELFAATAQGEWVNRGGSYGVFKTWNGREVCMAWSAGIVTCYPTETAVERQARLDAVAAQQLAQQQAAAQAAAAAQQQQAQQQAQQPIGPQMPQPAAQQPAAVQPAGAVPAAVPAGAPVAQQPAGQQDMEDEEPAAAQQPQTVVRDGYTWLADLSWWWDPQLNRWREAIETDENGRVINDWLNPT